MFKMDGMAGNGWILLDWPQMAKNSLKLHSKA